MKKLLLYKYHKDYYGPLEIIFTFLCYEQNIKNIILVCKDFNLAFYKSLNQITNKYLDDIYIYACIAGHFETVKLILNNNKHLEELSSYINIYTGYTYLTSGFKYSCKFNHLKIVKYFLNNEESVLKEPEKLEFYTKRKTTLYKTTPTVFSKNLEQKIDSCDNTKTGIRFQIGFDNVFDEVERYIDFIGFGTYELFKRGKISGLSFYLYIVIKVILLLFYLLVLPLYLISWVFKGLRIMDKYIDHKFKFLNCFKILLFLVIFLNILVWGYYLIFELKSGDYFNEFPLIYKIIGKMLEINVTKY